MARLRHRRMGTQAHSAISATNPLARIDGNRGRPLVPDCLVPRHGLPSSGCPSFGGPLGGGGISAPGLGQRRPEPEPVCPPPSGKSRHSGPGGTAPGPGPGIGAVVWSPPSPPVRTVILGPAYLQNPAQKGPNFSGFLGPAVQRPGGVGGLRPLPSSYCAISAEHARRGARAETTSRRVRRGHGRASGGARRGMESERGALEWKWLVSRWCARSRALASLGRDPRLVA